MLVGEALALPGFQDRFAAPLFMLRRASLVPFAPRFVAASGRRMPAGAYNPP